MTASPFADIRQLAVSPPAPGPSPVLEQGGRLAEISAWLTAWSGKSPPAVNRPVVALYAGARQGGGPRGYARDRLEALAKQPDLLIPGVIVAEAARTAAAVCLALFGGEASDWSDDPEPVAVAVARAQAEGMGDDPLEILRQLGGRETAAVVGAILAARTQKIPVLLDGYAACAAAAIVRAVEPGAIDHCLAAHVSPATGHARLLETLDKRPLLALDTLDEEGVGGASALALVKLACEVR